MTLQRRLLVLLLLGAPVIWLIAVAYSGWRASLEIDELFDTQQIRLAQQVLAMLPSGTIDAALVPPARPGKHGEADLRDLSIAVWDRSGKRLLVDREGTALPFLPAADGFADTELNGQPWRVFYLRSADGLLHVAVGQRRGERDDVLRDVLLTQLLPWVLTLPLLLALIAGGVRRALRPVRALAREIESRRPDDLRPITTEAPAELAPLVASMNRLFAGIGTAIDNERRLIADAAHELRTPLAALSAQWEAAEAARRAGDLPAREQAQRQIGPGIDRMSHLVSQLLTLSRAEGAPAPRTAAVDWERVVRQALSDCLPLIEASGGDVTVEWPSHGVVPLPLLGDESLLATLLRNLIDNALRYGPPRTTVRVRFFSDALVVEDDGPGVAPDVLARLGDRFFRPPGQSQSGSGLGTSIVMRVAALHDLSVRFSNRVDGHGLRFELRRRGDRN
mgnify:CR=1 FL=1